MDPTPSFTATSGLAPRLLGHDAIGARFAWRGCYFIHVYGAGQPNMLEAQAERMTLIREHGDIGMFIIVDADRGRGHDSHRSDMNDNSSNDVLFTSITIRGGGFMAGAVLAFASTMMNIVRSKVPRKLTRTVEEASLWAAPQMKVPTTHTELREALDRMVEACEGLHAE